MAGPVSVCSSYRSRSSRRPERAADAERSKSSEDGGVGTISSSRMVRRSRLSPGAVRTGTGDFATAFFAVTFFAAAFFAATFLATGAVRFRALATVFEATRAVAFFRADAVFLLADFFAAFLPIERERPTLPRVLAAF